ncbi:MAG: hypothetical protein DRO52_01235 [Candidatus Hecatellales archaeon]|nr:MAG: hypothetical protein DRO52_01235 [Candidatus Hecatellales archaeon]
MSNHLLKELDERFRFHALLLLGVDYGSVKKAGERLLEGGRPPPSFKGKVIDCLDCFEASLLDVLLAREGLTKGLDYYFLQTPNRKFILMLRSLRGEKAVKGLDLLRSLSRVKKYAIRILEEWGVRGRLKVRDLDEALRLGYEVLKVRDKIFMGKCPKCGRRSPSRIVERISNGRFLIYARKFCCGFVVRGEVSIERETPILG